MKIRNLKFANQLRGWSVDHTHFANFNLLVGKSGAGKTQILRALRTIAGAGLGQRQRQKCPNGCAWEIDIEIDGLTYRWSAETSIVADAPMAVFINNENMDDMSVPGPVYISERIEQTVPHMLLVERDAQAFKYRGQELPRLKADTSAISLLGEDEALAPLFGALRSVAISEAPGEPEDLLIPYYADRMAGMHKKYRLLDALREATELRLLEKAFILQKHHRRVFSQMELDYRSIFPNVMEVHVGTYDEFVEHQQSRPPFPILTIAVKERGVKQWILADSLSSGMLRSLVHLLEITLLPVGAVLLVDELENSLGVNCLDSVVSLLVNRSREIQVIATSHHPYVINAIPVGSWRIVSRHGSEITVKDGASVPELNSRSSQEEFIRLINLPELQESCV